MNFPIPLIHTIDTSQQAIDAGCDCVMIKFDGWPVLINCIGTEGHVLSALDDAHRVIHKTPSLQRLESLDHIVTLEPLSALFVGAKNRTNPVIYLYDTWWMDDQDVQDQSYRSRYVLTRTNAKKLDERFQVVAVAPVAAARVMWQDVVKHGYKGLVFRRSKDNAAGELYVMRHYEEMPREFV